MGRRILISAYACEPNRGSEPDIGWQWALAYREIAEIWVLTRANNRAVIERWEAEHGSTGINWIWVDAPAWVLEVKKRLGRPGILGYYWLWQFYAQKKAVALERSMGTFDWAHQLTMNGFREPGRLDKLGSPLVWGPIGGLQNSDWALSRLRSFRIACLELCRTIVNELTKWVGIRSIRAVRRRALVLGANYDSMKWINLWRKNKPSCQLLEIGAPSVVPVDKVCNPLEILWAGNDEGRKNPEFAILAWYRLRQKDSGFSLTMLGLSAKRQSELKRWAERRGINVSDGVTMVHWVSLTELSKHYAQAGQFWFTSYRDTSGTVALWALAYGLPCIGFNHQGAAIMLSEGRGTLIAGATLGDKLEKWVDVAWDIRCRETGVCHQPVRPFPSMHIEWQPKPYFVAEMLEQILSVK